MHVLRLGTGDLRVEARGKESGKGWLCRWSQEEIRAETGMKGAPLLLLIKYNTCLPSEGRSLLWEMNIEMASV